MTRTGIEPPETTPTYARSAEEILSAYDVTVGRGLDEAEVARRVSRHGQNALEEKAAVPGWRKIISLLADKMTIVLLVAAVVSAVVSREWETPVVILLVITLNTFLNYKQEAKAEDSLAALREMSVATSRVRRSGVERQIDRAQIVPGDVVLLEAGDTVPADGRVVEASRLQVAESALTGESAPVDKGVGVLPPDDVPLGERSNVLFMNTEVTRGRAVMVVTDTGMATQMGQIAGLLGSASDEKTPLQRRIDKLAGMLTLIALVVVSIVFVMGLIRGQSWSDLLITAVSLAVATIPEGLTAVVAFTLAMGATRLAERGAIIKQLAAVETLGSTSHIATDKTGTLTLNKMTARRVSTAGGRYRVTGDGYNPEGRILTPDGNPPPQSLSQAFLAMALCNDGVVRDGELVGDPTDGALVVLAEKGGIDVEGARRHLPRVAEVPFDSDYKLQATFHERDGRILVCVKGAPGAIADAASHLLGPDGVPRELTRADRDELHEHIGQMAREGMRTMMVAGKQIDTLPEGADALFDEVRDLTLYALIGIVDPPRSEAADAIREAHEAGIRVHMITGDHLVTASAIADTLGIGGDHASGAELDELDDDQLRERSENLGVLARVAPEHKIRVVKSLQDRGHVVAMTGDGVNDAPALKQADIGVAMGITGTDVSKGAARMILTDDNFATIVEAVRLGRGIYDNVLKFVRFQLTTSWGFVMMFLAASAFGIAGGAPFTALQILWVNIIMDGPPALALGVEPADKDVMKRPPRPAGEHLLTRGRVIGIAGGALWMSVATLLVILFADEVFPGISDAAVTTLAFTTFVFFQVFNLLNVRSDESVFSRRSLTNPAIWISLAVVLVFQVLVVELAFLQNIFSTAGLSSQQWAFAVAVGSSILWLEEIRKLGVRAYQRRR
ncbi:cation-translocating P-type ATPase [Blastococcus sp. Marseille-P5729]|uniref:cation-translocating P-type ATPase n=1 Tax=Blastococcus sp. Marseille-P5729 TaxID=2086582 RepID=UPI0018FE809E|nr:cation-translocating P-type ATPase [Blastococcus sp. Marseille-P5729]